MLPQTSTDGLAGMDAGLIIGSPTAASLMIFACILSIIVYKCCKCPSPTRVGPVVDGPSQTSPKRAPMSPEPLPLPGPPIFIVPVDRFPIGPDRPIRDYSFIRPDPPAPDPIPRSRLTFSRSMGSFAKPDLLSEVDVYGPVYPSTTVKANCLFSVCQEYFKSLKLDDYFQRNHDCYCKKCHLNDSQKTHKQGGYESTIPYGWARFRIETDQAHSMGRNIFQSWATSYYGTCEEKLEQILRNRFIPLPGDKLLDGRIFSDHSLDGQHCFTSPSINYASNCQRSPMKQFTSANGTVYNVQVVLQCKQKPGTFIIQRGQPGLCNIILANEIEWKTNQRATLTPTGLMIRMVKT